MSSRVYTYTYHAFVIDHYQYFIFSNVWVSIKCVGAWYPIHLFYPLPSCFYMFLVWARYPGSRAELKIETTKERKDHQPKAYLSLIELERILKLWTNLNLPGLQISELAVCSIHHHNNSLIIIMLGAFFLQSAPTSSRRSLSYLKLADLCILSHHRLWMEHGIV